MIPKISLAAAFLLIVAPPMACASNRGAANPAPIIRDWRQSPANIIVAQDDQSNAGTDTDSDNNSDSDSNDNDDNQNDNNDQMDQNAAGNDQPLPPQGFNGNENDPNTAPQFNQAPQPQPVNPYQ